LALSARSLATGYCLKSLAPFCFCLWFGFYKVVAVLEAGADAMVVAAAGYQRRRPVSCKNLLEEILHGDPGALISLLVVGRRGGPSSGMSQLVKVCSALP
jgi:hypothetical protein